MYAIVEIAGQQFKVEDNQQIYVHNLNKEVGDVVTFEKVLLLDNGGKISVGIPTVANCCISAKVLANVKGDKVIVFKKKRRKGYQRKKGHRQMFTQIQIEKINIQ